MTKAQRALIDIQGKQSELRSRLAVLAAQETRTADEETELTTVETKLSGCEPELRSALAAAAAEDDSARTVQTTDPENRERLELRGKTGIGDFLAAAAVGGAVTGAAAEYAAACGVPVGGHLPMAIFAGSAPTVETRAVTPGPAVKGALQPTVPYRVRAVGGGIPRDRYADGPNPARYRSRKITTAPPADTVAKDGAAPATAAAVSLVNQAPVRIAGSFEVRTEDLAVMPTLEAALSEAMQGSLSNELDEQTFNGAAGELDGLFTQATAVSAASAVETYVTGIASIRGVGGRATRLHPR